MQIEPAGRTGYWIAIPLVLLSILALTAGFVEIPPYMGDVPSFTNQMRTALPAPQTLPSAGPNLETKLSVVTEPSSCWVSASPMSRFTAGPPFSSL